MTTTTLTSQTDQTIITNTGTSTTSEITTTPTTSTLSATTTSPTTTTYTSTSSSTPTYTYSVMTTTPTTTTTSGTSTSTETHSTTFATTTLTTETDVQGNLVYPVWEIILYLIGSGGGSLDDFGMFIALGLIAIVAACTCTWIFVRRRPSYEYEH
jgi:hypothetical protein